MKDLNCCGIYKIINVINNKYYIGSSFNIKKRIRKHFELLKRNKHHSTHLQNAYNKYGKNVFKIEVLEICNRNNILYIEQKYLDNIPDWKCVYNISRMAFGCNYDLSTHPNEKEIRFKMSNSCKGKHTKPFYINNIRYETLKDAAINFNLNIKTISIRIKNWKYKNYYYENNPKIGEYDSLLHKDYINKQYYIKKKYYCSCGCGKEIGQYAKYHKDCRKINQKQTYKDNPVIINNIEYKNSKIASNSLKIEYATLIYRINSKTITFKNYYYKNKPKILNSLITIEEINKKISEKNKGNLGSNHKPFKINNNIYLSLGLASKELLIPKNTIRNRLNNIKYTEYQYI